MSMEWIYMWTRKKVRRLENLVHSEATVIEKGLPVTVTIALKHELYHCITTLFIDNTTDV